MEDMPSDKVISIEPVRRRREFENLLARPDPDKLFDIPFDDIAQYLDCANESMNDPVVFGPRALTAIRRLFAHFGIQETPQTIAEFNGALHYCKFLQLQTWTGSVTVTDATLHLEVVVELAKVHYPELVESLQAYIVKDIAALQRIASERLTLKEMAAHYHFEFGWLSGNNRRRREEGLPLE